MPDPQELHGRKLAVVFAGLMLVMLIAALDATIVATALPTIAGDLGGLNHIAWVTTAYLLAETVVTPLYGKLGDLYGRRLVLQIGAGRLPDRIRRYAGSATSSRCSSSSGRSRGSVAAA